MRLNLKVPFAEKDQAKKLGARWDPARKLWYIEGKTDVAAFARWTPVPHDPGSADVPAPARTRAKTGSATGGIHTGARYVEQARVCDCPPWELCATCRPLALKP